MLISEEEKKYQSGQGNIEKQLYAKDSISEIDRELLLERGRLVTVRPHSRFVDFPEHRHNYVEMMYVVQAVLRYINSDCKNANLTKIAADTHQSMTVLSKLIKQKTGYTFQELLQHKRFETAAHLLAETDLSVEEIALDVGYENQSYFFRQFKERYGMTPRKYRIVHRTARS